MRMLVIVLVPRAAGAYAVAVRKGTGGDVRAARVAAASICGVTNANWPCERAGSTPQSVHAARYLACSVSARHGGQHSQE